METRKQIIISTHPTKRGEYFASSSFEGVVQRLNEGAAEIDVEHDPRTPPVGRMVSAKVVPLQDGHVGIEGEMQLFGEEDLGATFPLQNILLRARNYELERATLRIDEHYYLNAEARRDAEEAAKELGVRLQFHGKNSLEPPTWLTVALVCGLGAFATSVLTEFGKDAHKLIKRCVIGLYKKYHHQKRDNLVLFEFYVVQNGEPMVISVVLTEPSDSDIDAFLTAGLPFLDTHLPTLLQRDEPLRRLAFEFKDRELKLLYGVRKDGIPRFPSKEVKQRF